MKKTVLVMLLLIWGLTACKDYTLSESPEVNITSGDTVIEHVVGLNAWDGIAYDREDGFSFIMKDKSKMQLEYIKLNEEITIQFDGPSPDTVRLYDNILKDDGTEKYNVPVKEIPIEIVGGKGSFILDFNFAAALSSHSKDYEPGASIRGFKLVCTWGDNECEYTFIFRSDAH